MQFSEREIPAKTARAELDLGREGGHSKRRILHAKDMTGREIERALLKPRSRASRTSRSSRTISPLISSRARSSGYVGENRCLGAYVLDKKAAQVETFAAPVTLLATGGCGKVYLYTTNPDIATGDGVAMAYRAGAAGGEHGVHPVPSDLPLSSQGEVVSHQRSRARRRRRAQDASTASSSYFGSVVALVIAALVALPHGVGTAALAALAVGGASFVEGYLITPFLQGRSLMVPPIVLLFFILVFGALFGAMGVALAVPATVVIFVGWDVFKSAPDARVERRPG